MLSWYALGWTKNVRLFPDSFPLELSPERALRLLLGTVICAPAAFAASRTDAANTSR